MQKFHNPKVLKATVKSIDFRKKVVITAALGITAEGIEVDIFTVSSWIMTGDYTWALIGGILGFIWSLIAFRIISVKFPKRIMKNVAVGLLYTVGFIILTSGLI